MAKGGILRISPEDRMQRGLMKEQLLAARAARKRQSGLFDMLLGGGDAAGGGGLIGDLIGGGGLQIGGPGGAGGGGGGMGSPGFQDPASGGGTTAPPFSGGSYGSGQRAALEEQFKTAQANMLGSLEARGLGGSSLVGPGMASVARQQSLAGGELEDRLFREQLQFRAAERAPLFGLLGQLLGSVGV